MRSIFVDLDGTLGDFAGHYETLFGEPFLRSLAVDSDPKAWVQIIDNRTFFRDMPLLPDALTLWAGVKALHPNPVVLTGIKQRVPDIGDHKRAWVARHLGPDVPVICCLASDKSTHGQPGDILIDDWPKYRHRWERMGGIFIQHTSAETSLAALNTLWSATNE